MQLAQPTPHQSWLILRALKGMIRGTVSRSLIQAAQRLWLKSAFDWQHLEPISWDELTPHLQDPVLRIQLIQAMVVLVILDEEIDWSLYHRIRHLCQRWQISPACLRPLWLWNCRLHGVLALEVYLCSFIVQKYGYELQHRGWGWLVRGALHYVGRPDPILAARYHQLQDLPRDTLGYGFWQFCRRQGYRFPGDPGGVHEGLTFHDMTHVLGGYDTSALGELQAVAMTVGYQRSGDPLASLLFILLQQQLGIQVGVLSQARRGGLEQPQAADQFLQALIEGASMTVDLSESWDPWPVMTCSVEELRRIYGLEPVGVRSSGSPCAQTVTPLR